MSPINRTDSYFRFTPGDPPLKTDDAQYPPAPPVPAPGPPVELGPLAALVGEWEGEGFNTIWRPHFPSAESDRFLELNLTTEKLAFSPISGEIPNRGLLQQGIAMFGVTYLQQISKRGEPMAGLHIEPGIWAVVPETTAPAEPPSVVRMASIPHGTAINAQGTASVSNGPPVIPENNIIPFSIGGTPLSNSDFTSASAEFTQLNLATPNQFREVANGTDQNGVDQAMIENPNSVLARALAAMPTPVKETTTLDVLTSNPDISDGGTANTVFLQSGNANASVVAATFWIEALEGSGVQLQYTQTVMLDFNGLRWPHVTVATLQKTASAPAGA